VRVGPEGSQQDFLLHEGIICKRSEFFRCAMNGNWSEKKARLVKLPEDDPKIFALYVNLVYIGELSRLSGLTKMTSNEFQAQILSIVKFYVLAEKLQDKQAKNTALQTIHTDMIWKSSADKLPNAEIVEFMYKNTLKGSPGRRLMVDIWTDENAKCILEQSEVICKEFLVDLAYSLHAYRPLRMQNVASASSFTKYQEKL